MNKEINPTMPIAKSELRTMDRHWYLKMEEMYGEELRPAIEIIKSNLPPVKSKRVMDIISSVVHAFCLSLTKAGEGSDEYILMNMPVFVYHFDGLFIEQLPFMTCMAKYNVSKRVLLRSLTSSSGKYSESFALREQKNKYVFLRYKIITHEHTIIEKDWKGKYGEIIEPPSKRTERYKKNNRRK